MSNRTIGLNPDGSYPIQDETICQPGPQVPVAWPNECNRTVPEALRFLARNPRPAGGEDRFNSLHLLQLAGEIESMVSRPLYAEPPAGSQGEGVDLWRGLYDPAKLPERNAQYGDTYHPDLPSWPEFGREESIAPLLTIQGFDLATVEGEFSEEALETGDHRYWQELRDWQPQPPAGDGWRLVVVCETEDGPVAWFVRPTALTEGWGLVQLVSGTGDGGKGGDKLAPEQAAIAATGKQAGEVLGDALRQAMRDARAEVFNNEPHVIATLNWLERRAAEIAARQPGAQERVAWASTGATGHKVVAMPGLHKLPYGDYDLYAAPSAQGIDLGPARELLRRRIAQWRSHLPSDPYAPGTVAISGDGEGGYNNDVRMYREGIAVMDKVLALIEGERDAAPGVSHG